MAGDRLLSHTGMVLPVTEVANTQEWAIVYNVRVAECHTYFVGAEDWGFSVWAHNLLSCVEAKNIIRAELEAEFGISANLGHGFGTVRSRSEWASYQYLKEGVAAELKEVVKKLYPTIDEARLGQVAERAALRILQAPATQGLDVGAVCPSYSESPQV